MPKPIPDHSGVDFGLTALDYAKHRAGFPESLFERLLEHGVGRPGHLVIDLGTGTGTLARGFARRGCRSVGVDRAVQMLMQARSLGVTSGVVARYVQSRAEQVGLAPEIADVVTAGQCWHWFARAEAAAEAMRLLNSGGWLVIAHYDWLPLAGSLPEATERLIEAHNPAWRLGGGDGLYPAWLDDLTRAGFAGVTSFHYDEPASYTPLAWLGRIRASAGVGASLAPAAVEAFDREHAALLAARFPGDRLLVPHRVFAALGRRPGRQRSDQEERTVP